MLGPCLFICNTRMLIYGLILEVKSYHMLNGNHIGKRRLILRMFATKPLTGWDSLATNARIISVSGENLANWYLS